MTVQDVQKFKDRKLPLYHGTLESGMILMVPPGFAFATCAAPQADKDQSAIKTFFLPAESLSFVSEQLCAVKHFSSGPSDQIRVIDMLLDLCGVSS